MNNSDKTNLTKRSLIVSILAMTVCIAMLVGTTFAWFTDSASTSVNRIQAGELKFDLLEWKADVNNGQGGFVSIKNSNDPIFNYDRWEPGYSDAHLFKIENIGDLALKFRLSFSVDGEVGLLAEVIDVYYKADADSLPGSFEAVTAENSGYQNVGTLKALIDDPDGLARGILMPPQTSANENEIDTESNAEEKSYVTACIVLYMREGVGNQYQGQSVGNNFDLNLVATQYTQESDSFGSDYDAEAEYPVMTAEDFISAVNMIGNNGSGIITLGKDITLTDTSVNITGEKNVAVNTNGHTLKSIWTPASASSAFTVDGGSTLSLVGSGTIEAYAENPDVTWAAGFPGYANNAITNKGTLIVDGATVKVTTDKVGGSGKLGASYCIDNYAGSKLEVKSGNIINLQNIAVRIFTSSASDSVDVTIDGGTIEGSRGIWLQLAGSSSNVAPKVNLVINGGNINTNEQFENSNNSCLALYSYSFGNSFNNTNVTINGGNFLGYVAFGGGRKVGRETVNITGGTFEAYYYEEGQPVQDHDCVGRYTSTGWESIAH